MNNDISIIIETLYQVAIDLEKKDKPTAIKSLETIKGKVEYYTSKAKDYAQYSEQWHKKSIDEAGQLILEITESVKDWEENERQISKINGIIETEKDAIKLANESMKSKQEALARFEEKYRNARGCKKEQIRKNAREHIQICQIQIAEHQKNINSGEGKSQDLRKDLSKNKKKNTTLRFFEFTLNKELLVQKRKTAFYTQINLFCSNIQNVLSDIDSQVNRIHHIVDQLNNEKPTIENYRPSQKSTLTLKQAIVQFGKELEDNASLASMEEEGIMEKQWMKYVDDDRLLSELTIPGTHNSGTFAIDLAALNCQTLTISEQLDHGIRYLDIELRKDKNTSSTLVLYPQQNDQKINFEEKILEPCYLFLKRNPTETIIISVKETNENFIAPLIKAIVEKVPEKWYVKIDEIPKLKDIRGKIVLFRRFDNMDIGIDSQGGWPNNTAQDFSHHNVTLHVQDVHNISSISNDCAVKVNKYVKDCLIKASEEISEKAPLKPSNKIFINFTSISTDKNGSTPYEMAETCIPLFPLFYKYAEGKSFLRYGIIAMDFPEIAPDLIQKIIDCNFCSYLNALSFRTKDNKAGLIIDPL